MPADAPSASPLDPHVVIVGGGFAGLAAARRLARAPVRITLIDRTNHYLFQPLLYQVATGLLSPADVAMPTRFLLRRQKNATVLLGEVTAIDLSSRALQAGGTHTTFDYLIVGTGARHSYFGHPEWEPMAPGLKTLEDARHIRHRFLGAFEAAEKTLDPAEQDALMTFVIIGGGPTGVELAGVLPTIARKGIRSEFRRVDTAKIRVLLLEGGPRLLPTFPEPLSKRACSDLEALGVHCRTGALVTRVTQDAVYLGDERIPTRTVFWAAGNAASPLVRAMGVAVDRTGRAVVESDLSVPGAPHVFVVGDAAAAALAIESESNSAARPGSTQYVPGLAGAAQQMGRHAADMIVASLENGSRKPFRYRNRGTLAVIGRRRAVADLNKIHLTGALAWWMWLTVHFAFLGGFRNRVSVLLSWAYAYVTFRPGARLIVEEDGVTAPAAMRLRPPA
jgi:NADH dehydrogenase